MSNQHSCLFCSQPLLRHISQQGIYWFCSHCHQEIPDIENLKEAKFSLRDIISNQLAKRKQLEKKLLPTTTTHTCQKITEESPSLAFADSLSQVANRYRLQVYLEQDWQRMGQEQAPLSLIIGDLDFFQTYNDTYGHSAGDQCLQQVATAIANDVKHPLRLLPTYGGEEFIIILPYTKAETAVQIAEKIRCRVKGLEILQPNLGWSKHLTISLGVASMMPSQEYSSTMLINATVQALYQAKAKGRDRVILHEQLLRQTEVLVKKRPTAQLQKIG